VALVVIGSSLAVAALAAAAFVSIGTRRTKRGARRGIAVARGLRRGVMVGCVIALVALLRLVDGLTPLTAVFVIAPFVVAEVVLSTRRA
jgi:CHASE2 domain-containing sensor protein